MKQVVHTACPPDCPDACGGLITVEDGRATKIQGDPEHPVTRGFLCAKVAKYLDRVYSPDRVLYPMRRVKPKGTTPRGAGHCAGLPRCLAGSLPNAAPNPSCPTLTEERSARSTALPWTAVSSIAWALHNWSAASALPPAKKA